MPLIERVGIAPVVTVEGSWQRSVTERWADHILAGSAYGGRWGRPDSFAVLYLGRPRESVVVGQGYTANVLPQGAKDLLFTLKW